MPVFHAYLPKGRFSSERKVAIGNALNQSLVDALNIPPGDRFIVLSEHAKDELFIDPTFMDMNRSDDAMIITVMVGAHRPLEQRQTLMATISRLLHENVDIAPDDVFIAIVPVPNENFSFGRGIAQLASVAPKW
jgi:phenylpyruvate tautomerase PptA (4-oxalocrotonate tautomerase family)